MLKYVSKFTLDILPSVVATIVGAYIVNHYIVTKPGTGAPVAAAVSTTEPKAEAKVAPEAAKADAKAPEKAPETSSDVANIPEPGVKAKGISEKAILEKSATEKPGRDAPPPARAARKGGCQVYSGTVAAFCAGFRAGRRRAKCCTVSAAS